MLKKSIKLKSIKHLINELIFIGIKIKKLLWIITIF